MILVIKKVSVDYGRDRDIQIGRLLIHRIMQLIPQKIRTSWYLGVLKAPRAAL